MMFIVKLNADVGVSLAIKVDSESFAAGVVSSETDEFIWFITIYFTWIFQTLSDI